MMFICGWGKDDYFIGAVPQPMKEDQKFKEWKVQNNMVMSLLINLMNNDIGENFVLYEQLIGAVPWAMKEDSKFKEWKVKNNMVMSWLINLVNNDREKFYTLRNSARNLGSSKEDLFKYRRHNSGIWNKREDLCQGDLFVTQYFSLLTHYWL